MLNLTFGDSASSPLSNSALGGLLFGAAAALHVDNADAFPCALVRMPHAGGGPFIETLHSNTPIRQSGSFQGIAWRADDALLFGIIQLDENRIETTSETKLQTAARSAYGRIFDLLHAQKFPHVLRYWNYMADINGVVNGLERYRHFNMGRYQAFINGRENISGNVPAACALGTKDGTSFTIAFLAARQPSVPIENPRQVSAYHYPACYGPRSPLFSRASVFHAGNANHIFLSGTASIVGHETMHAGSIEKQTYETVKNIRTVIHESVKKTGIAFAAENLHYIAYVRHATDVPVARRIIHEEFGSKVHIFFLLADICRADLLLELEGWARLPEK